MHTLSPVFSRANGPAVCQAMLEANALTFAAACERKELVINCKKRMSECAAKASKT